MAKSIEVTVNHSDGVIDVATGNVSIESQFPGGPGAQQAHLLDISDSASAPVKSLTSALQALEKPETLFDEDGDGKDTAGASDQAADAATFTAAAGAVTCVEPAFKGVLPTIDRPTVVTKPDYRSRIMVSTMEHFLNDAAGCDHSSDRSQAEAAPAAVSA